MKHPDLQGFDAEEQEEWLDALEGVLKREGVAAALLCCKAWRGGLRGPERVCHLRYRRPIAIPFLRRTKCRCPATCSWSVVSAV